MNFSEWVKEEEKKKKKQNEETQRNSSLSFSEWVNAEYGLEDDTPVVNSTTLTDIAPVRSDRGKADLFGLDLFQKSEGNVVQGILGTVGDLGLEVVKGAGGLVEGVTDLILYGAAGVADAFGGDKIAENWRENAKKNEVNTLTQGADDFLEKYSYAGNTLDAVAQGVGQVGSLILTGGLASTGAGATMLTTGLMGASGVGSGMSEAYESGASDEDALTYGLISGAADALTEMIFGGLGKGVNALGFGKGLLSADDMLAKTVSNKFKSQIGKNLAEFGIKAGAEGVEEVLAGFAQAAGKKLTYMNEEDFWGIVNDENLLEQFVVGAMTSGIAQAGSVKTANNTGRDFITGLTQNEQTVVDSLYESEIADKDLDKKEKKKIYDQILTKLDKGYIGIEDIERTLGGETYKAYKETSDSEKALRDKLTASQKEYNELKDIHWREKTAEQFDRMAELETEIKNLEAQVKETTSNSKLNDMKSQLSKKVFELTKNDTKLQESYREEMRRGQDLELDVEQYKGAAKITAQNLLKGGMNNTNRVHDVADFLTKLSADKNIVFDVATAKKLADAGLAVDGKQVNGVITKDGIVLNLESSAVLETTVGHEITHALEGTEHYEVLKNAIKEYAELKGVYADKYSSLESIYAKKDAQGNILKDANGNNVWIRDDVDIDSEVVADLVGEYLFTDADFINNLSVKHRNVFQKVYDEIKYLLKIATAGSEEARKLEEVKRAFDKAYKEDAEVDTAEVADNEVKYSIREEAPPKETGIAYKVFFVKDGKLYPPMVANPEGADTPMGVWLNADVGQSAPPSKTGRQQVKAGGKGTQGGGGSLAFRPGWHLGDLPRASQFDRVNPETGKKELFPENFVWAEVEYAKDVDYQEEAMSYGYTENGKFRHAYAGLPRLPENGYYRYRTNPKPDTVPWIITGAMKVNRLLSDAEVNEILAKNGVEPVHRQGGDVGLEKFGVEGDVKYSLSESKTLYTGSPVTDITQFKVGGANGAKQTGDRYGRGIYLTTNKTTAKGYAGDSGRVYEINADDLNIFDLNNPITEEMKATLRRELNGKDKQFRNSVLRNFRTEKTFTDFESAEQFFDEQRKVWKEEDGYYSANKPEIKSADDKTGIAVIEYTDFVNIDNAIGSLTGNQLYDALKSISTDDFASFITGHGFDGIAFDEDANNQQYVIYRNEDRLNILPDSKAKYSLSAETDKTYLDAVNRGDTKTAQMMVEDVAKELGYAIRAYHGTARGDRVGNVFLPERATSGPMAFFTDDRTIAENYSKSKQDTSIAYDPDFDRYETQFRIKIKDQDIPLYRAWAYLPFDARSRITKAAGQLRENWDGDNELMLDPDTNEANGGFQWQLKEARGNTIQALIEQWLNSGNLFNEEVRFLDVLEMAGVTEEFKKLGIDSIYFKDPNAKHEKVYETFLKIVNPFDTANSNEQFIAGLEAWYEEQDQDQYVRENMESDLWDKNGIDAYDFADRLRRDIENNTTHAWTSIPDSVTDYLKHLGYDGIKDTGGKFGGDSHIVWIPFSSEQVKSADPVTYDDAGNVIPLSQRFSEASNDIRYSLSDPNDIAPVDFQKSAKYLMVDKSITQDFGDIAPVAKRTDAPVATDDEEIKAETLVDKDSFVVRRAKELYEEITNLKKGVRASKSLGYLLDHGHEWRSIKTALLNIRDNPNQVVNENSAAESVAREMLGREYDEMVYELNEQTDVAESVRIKMKNIQTEIDNNEKLREQANSDYDAEIAEVQAKYDAKKNKNTIEANNLLRRIERLNRMKNTNDANYAKRIGDLEARLEKMSQPTYKTAMQRKKKQSEYTTLMESLVGDTSTWVDKKLGISYKVNTLRRNLRDIVRDASGKQDIAKADAIYDELQGNYNRHEAELKRESKRLKQVFADMKLTSAEDTYAHMLGEFRHNPDSKLTEEAVKEYYEQHKKDIDTAKVDKAIEEARKTFDELIARVNERLREQGMKEIPYRQGYFPHFTNPKQGFLAKLFNWKPVDHEIPTSIAGITETFNPERSWQSFNKQRKSDLTDYSLAQGLDTYIHGSLDWIYHIEDIQKRRALENHIRYTHSEEGVKARIDAIRNSEELDADEMQDQIDLVYAEANNPLNNFVTDLRAGTNTLAAKKSSMDRALEEKTNRKIYSVMTNLNNRVSANMVVGSISSAMTNFIPIVQSWVEVSPMYSLRGMGDTIRSTARDDGIINKSTFLTNRLIEEEKLYKTGWDKASDKAAFLMNAIDSFTSQTVWRSKYLQNISEGMSETEAIQNADQFAENVIAGRSRGNMPTIFDAKNPLTKIFTAFQLEVANQYGYMFKDAPTDSKNKARLVKGFATMFIGSYLYNALYSSLVGRNAAFDPLSIIEDLLGDLEDEEEEEAIVNLANNVIEEIPFVGSLFGGGRIPISSALPYSGEYEGFSKLVTDISDENWENVFNEMLSPLYYLAFPFGGGQIKKTNEGLGMFSEDHPIAGSYTASGNLRFPVEDNFINRMQAALFGQYASANARDYFDNNRTALKEKQIQEFIDVDIPIRDYWEYREGLSDQKTIEDKFDYIAGLDLPVSKKNILINNIVDREEAVDLEGYEDFSSYEEFDFATKNPEKYTVAKAVGGYNSYVTHYKAMNDISADKDENGKSIVGSRKEKIIDYVNNLDIDYGMKIILFKSEYKADDTYNYDILDYLNSRDDLTYEEIVTILTELDFTVDAQGNVYWD